MFGSGIGRWMGSRHGDRDVAMVFQGLALYPYLTVFENLAFGLRARGSPKNEVRSRVEAAARQLGLSEILARRPEALSGGERQRVALGRALVRRPRVFLLDEPFSSLDAPLRFMLRAELSELQRQLGVTILHVTHDQAEALALGDRVAVINQGRIVQFGTPSEVYHAPAHRSVAEFIGTPAMNVVPCSIAGQGSSWRFRVAGIEGKGPSDLASAGTWLSPLFDRGRIRDRAGFGYPCRACGRPWV